MKCFMFSNQNEVNTTFRCSQGNNFVFFFSVKVADNAKHVFRKWKCCTKFSLYLSLMKRCTKKNRKIRKYLLHCLRWQAEWQQWESPKHLIKKNIYVLWYFLLCIVEQPIPKAGKVCNEVTKRILFSGGIFLN